MPVLFLNQSTPVTTKVDTPNTRSSQLTFPLLELRCSNLKDIQQIHAQMVTTGFIHHYPSVTKLISRYFVFSDILDTTSLANACSSFNPNFHPNAMILNTVLRRLVDKNLPKTALLLYLDVLLEPFGLPDRFTFPSLLKACGQLTAYGEGKALHGQVVKLELSSDLYTQSSMIAMYAACGDVVSARAVFDKMGQKRNQVAWTSMINCYAKNRCPKEALHLYSLMLEEGLEADEFTIACVIAACAELKDLEFGRKMHDLVRRSGFRVCVVLGTALIDMYTKCGEINEAREIFDKLQHRNEVTWSAMIFGYARNNYNTEALKLFKEMVARDEYTPNEVTAMAALLAIAQSGDLMLGKWIHASLERAGLLHSTRLRNSLIDMYSKCGKIEIAFGIFREMKQKDIVSWNTMIGGFAVHGLVEEALAQFELMQMAGVEPNDITFIGVLSACGRAGWVKEGFRLFHDMSKKFGIIPKLEHYGCMTDLLSRAGKLAEADDFIGKMPMEPNGAVWGALLGGCAVYNNLELGLKAAKHLLETEPENDGVYVLLSNLFARMKKWEEVRKVRLLMHEKGVRKAPGFSSIVVDGLSYEFTVDDRSHPESERIYEMLSYVNDRLDAAGYVPNTAEVLLNVDDEAEKEDSVLNHSEKLAVCFGLIKTSPGDEILILKNLRICGNCHSAFKLVSEMFDRQIVIRDRSRFHHFRNGVCSCKDFW